MGKILCGKPENEDINNNSDKRYKINGEKEK